MNVKSKLLAVLVAGAFAPLTAYATNGYAPHGIGVKAQGMAGVGIALPQDSIAAGANPAGMAFVGNRFDAGLTWFRPQREAEITGSQFPAPGVNGTYDGNGEENFFIPEFGYNMMYNPNLALGISIFGNGGMNTQYDRGIPLFNINPVNGTSQTTGINLEQLFIAPTIAFKLAPNHSIGIAFNIIYQSFEAQGLQNFDQQGFTSSPGNVTNLGDDSAWGWSVRIGWTGEVIPGLTLGATYQTEGEMEEFDDYKGLFAEQGGFNIPSNYGIGAAWKPMPALTIAGDIMWVNYSDVKSISNPISKLFPFGPTGAANTLGSSDGPGFGWEDITIYKLGISYDINPAWTVRTGFSWGDNPIPASQTLFNILAPGVVEQHFTLGATWKIDPKSELSFSYMHAFENEVNGTSDSIPQNFGGGQANIKMYQDSLGIAYGMKF